MRRRLIPWLALALAGTAPAALAQPVPAPGPTSPPASGPAQPRGWSFGAGLEADPAVRFGILPNGMRYALRKNATPPGEASLRLRIDTGSLNERDDQLGVAHFLEHMVLNGTKNVPEGEFMKRLERHGLKLGPDTNATTDFEQTVYMLDLPETDADTVDTALFLLREVADKALFDPKSIDSERGIILAEERTRATPQLRQAMDELAYLYPGQLLSKRLPIGTTEVIRTAPRERFVQFYNAYYRPEKATLVAVGDFDVDAMEARIRKSFADWRGEGPAGAVADQGSPARRSPDAAIFVDPAIATRASVAWVRPPDLEPDSRARRKARVVETLGLTILNRRLDIIASNRVPAPFVAARATQNQIAETAEVTQVLAVAEAGKWQKALEVIDQEQRRLVQFGVTPGEVAREVANARTALAQAVAGAGTRQSRALATGLVGAVNRDTTPLSPAAGLSLFEEAVKDIGPQQLQSAVARLFSGSGPLLYLTTPVAVEGGKDALLAAYRSAGRTAVTAPVAARVLAWPYSSFGTPGEVAERREIAGIGATGVRFANGVRLTVKPTSFAKDRISVAVRVGDGKLDLVSPKAPLVGGITGGNFSAAGLKKMGSEAISQALTGKSFGVSLGVDEDAFVLSGTTRGEDLATQMQVLAAFVSEPGWRASPYLRAKSVFPQLLAQMAATPAGVWGRDGRALLVSGDRRWAMAGADEVAASSIADARALIEGPLVNDPIEVVIVGDVTVEDAVRQTAATFGALAPRTGQKAAPTRLAFPAATAEPVVLTHKGRADQGLAFIGWPTPDFHADMRESRTLDLLAEVFQLRLTEAIREKQGVSYAPRAGHVASTTFLGYGYLAGEVQAPPDKLDAFLAEAQSIASGLARAPVSADELVRAVRPLTERLQRSQASNEWWLGRLRDAQTDPRIVAAILSQPGDYRSVTPADLQRVAAKYMVPARAYKAKVVPETK